MEHLRIIVIHVALDFPLQPFIEGVHLHKFDVKPFNGQGVGCIIFLGDEAAADGAQ